MPKKKSIYLDYAAATPVDPVVSRATEKASKDFYANPSSVHRAGSDSACAVQDARSRIAKILNVKSPEIIFTASGTESNNLALLGIARSLKKQGNHIIVSAVEHASIHRACDILKKEGFKVLYAPINRDGSVNPTALKKLLTRKTVFVSCMLVQNEIGTIQPLKEISKIILDFRKKNKALFPLLHSDACQATGFLSIMPHEYGLDAMTLNAAKCYGPKGIALLWSHFPQYLSPLIVGGGQERGLRSGTENISAIAGFAKALEISEKKRIRESERLAELKKYCIQKIKKVAPDALVIAEKVQTVPHIISVAFSNISGEMIVQALSAKNIFVASGAACSSHETGPSHVVKALNLSRHYQDGVVRISLGRPTTKKEIDTLVSALVKILK